MAEEEQLVENHKIVTIGGGSGQFILLSGLRDMDGLDIKAVVSMVDSGGSTGRLRDEYGVLPPGDILKCVLALSPHRDTARQIFQSRFHTHERLKGHNAGNMLLTILSQYAGSFPAGVEALCEVLETKGRVYPVTVKKATLVAELTDGTKLFGESAIDMPRGQQREKIRNVFLVPHHSDSIEVYPPVIEAIEKADYLILGPGDLYTSIIPNLLISGVKDSIQKTGAKIIYIVNIMTKYGETDSFSAGDFLSHLEKYLGRPIDIVLINKKKPSENILLSYAVQKANYVHPSLPEHQKNGKMIVEEDFLDESGGIVRHDPHKLSFYIRGTIRHST
jgi:uncharacterized cofD-like protein